MTNTSSKLDTVGHTQRPPGAPRHASEKRRHADPAPVPVPHEPHQKAAVNVDDQQPIVDHAAAAKSRHREQKALRREAKKARRAARSNMAAAAAVLVAAPQTAMTASASQAAHLLILDAGNSQPNSSRDNCQAVTALPCSVAAPAEGVVKMAEVCKDPVDAAGPSAPVLGTALVPEEKKSSTQKKRKKRTRSASQTGVLDSQAIDNRPGSQSIQADPQPEHRVLAEGSTEAAKHDASGEAPKKKKRKLTASQSTDNLAANRQYSHQSPTVDTPMAQQADLQPTTSSPKVPRELAGENSCLCNPWEDHFLTRGYIDKCEDWLAEAVQGSANPKSVAVHIMVLAHYWEYQVVLLLREGRHCGLLHASETAFLQQISKIQLRIRGLAEQLQDLLPPSWMPAVLVTAGRILQGKSLICPVWKRLSFKVANVNGIFQLAHPKDLPHDCATQTVSWLLEALHPGPNDRRFAFYVAHWSYTARQAAATEEPRNAMASTSSPQMPSRQTQGRELTAQQASAVAEVPAVNQAAATPMEVRTATDAAEASCLILEEPGLANPEQAKTGPTLGLGSANCRGREGTVSHIVQADPTRTACQAATSGASELHAAAAQAQLSGKPQPLGSCDLGKSDATANAAHAQMTDRAAPVLPASQGHTSLHGKSTLATAQSAQKPPLAPNAGQKGKQVPDQQRAVASASAPDPAQQQAEQPVQLPAQQSAQKPAVSHKPARQPYVTEEPVQEECQQNAEQSPQGPNQKQAEKLRAAEDLTQMSAQQPAGPPTTSQEPAKKLVKQQHQQLAQKPARQPAQRQVDKLAQGPVQQPAQRALQKSARGPRQKSAQKSAQPQPEHESFDCQGLRLLPKDTPLCCEQAVHNQAGPEQTAAQLNAYLRLDDDGLAYAAATILSKVAPPPYDAAGGAAHKKPVAPELEPWLKRYGHYDVLVRQLLWWRAFWKHGKKDADAALVTRDGFVQVCLMGVQPALAAGTDKATGVRRAAQVCEAYLRMLRKIYGDELVMPPYIMSVDALNAQDTAGAEALSNLRLLQKRFVVYQPSKAAPHPTAAPGQPQSGPEQIRETSSCHQPGQAQQAARDGSTSIDVDIVGMEDHDDADSQPALLDWDEALLRLWKKAQQEVGPLNYGKVRDQLDPTAPSCGLQNAKWQAGRCVLDAVPDTVRVQDVINDSLLNKPHGFPRLYFTDGTFPGELPEGVTCQDDLPGLWCGVDQTANRMFPPALRSDRPGSFFKQMCVESNGAASFTMFAACGLATNITPFHQETKKRRSFNCGTGDFIVQPLCTAGNVRKLERVHAAVLGAHERHTCLLPLEMYLEEAIPLVCYIRDHGHAQMVELPEHSRHAFLSFSNAAASPPCIKVSCNDWHVESELSSAYLLEKLLANGREAGVEAEVGVGDADPDTWVETPYALRQPCSLHEETGEPMCKLGLDGTWQRPWADEMQTQECTDEDVAKQADRGNRCSDVEVLLVRCVQKEIDNLDGKLKDTAWNALVTTSQSLKVLQNALPVLLDLAIRAQSIGSDEADYFSKEYMHCLIYLVQKALSTAGLDAPLHQAEAFLAELHAKKGSKGSKQVRAGDGGSAEVRRMAKGDQVFTVFMHLQDAVDCTVNCSTTASRKKTAVAGLKQFTEAVEDLTQTELLECSMPTLRAHWLLAMHSELQASKMVNSRVDFDRWNKTRQHRCCLEELHDHHCQKLVQQYAEEWGVADYRA